MEKYAVCDIGSNTVVLIVYLMEDGKPVKTEYRSTPIHLIDYVDETRHMDRKGMLKLRETLEEYKKISDEAGASYFWADITEPCRITNLDELLDTIKDCGFIIHPLKGAEEAGYDYIGSSLSYPHINDGFAFDVGGGSTELISFKDKRVIDAVSFPLGCVRLAHLPLDNEDCRNALMNVRDMYPSFNNTGKTLIGIGGTMRFVGLVSDALYHTDMTLPVSKMKEMYQRLLDNDPEAIHAMKTMVSPARQPVFLPGIHMIIEITDMFEAETILISDTGIREGFLLNCIQKYVK